MTAEYQHVIDVQKLTKDYPSFRFGPVSLELEPGYVYGILGPNGAGKTTLLKMLMGLVQPATGSITVFGLDPRMHEKSIKQGIGFVPEEPFLYQNMNAQWFGRFARAHFTTWSDERYGQLLRSFKIDARAPSKTLSKGTRVKLQLALALAHNPQLLILDEPTSGLDPLIRREILDQIGAVVQDEKRTVLFSTHITEDVERIADYIVFVIDGQVALKEARETLRDQWYELMIDAPDAEGLPGLFSAKVVANGVVRVAVTEAARALAFMQQKGHKPLHQRPLDLDEILGELVSKEEIHDAGSSHACL
jgi:ABC-2 type transport system ATP-binding protein